MNIRAILQAAAPVMPVLTIEDAELAIPLAQALVGESGTSADAG